jgi:xanthine phosphoribosyltransferase
MKLLEERILRDGKVLGDDILKVDMFLNHQIDVTLLNEIGKEFHRLFQSAPINKILTIEASGIGIACIAAQYFSVPVVFAKKGAHRNVGENLYTSEVFSFTKNKGSTLEGIGIVIEKGFQPGGALIRGMGIHLESLAIVESMKNGTVVFTSQDC